MVLTWILSACLVPILSLNLIPPVGSVSMCKNETYTGTNYLLGRTQNDPKNCTCLVKTTEQTKNTKVIFNIDIFSGCKYKLVFYSNGNLQFKSCDSNISLPVFDSVTSGTIKLNLEPYRQNRSLTSFTVNIISQPETDLNMTCFVHEATPSTTTSTISTATSTSEDTSTQTLTNASSSTIPSTSTISTANTTTKYTSTSTDGSTPNVTDGNTSESNLTESTTYNNTKTFLPITDSDEHEYIGEIVGGVLGCLVLIACIVLIVCLIKGKRNRADRKGTVNGNLKMSRRTSNISRTKVNNNDSPNQEMLIIPNEVYVSMDSVQQPTFNTFNKRPEMEIIENDLYVSSDTIDKEYDNADPKMEIIENDLYVSSDTVDKSYDNAEPKMEIIENDLYVSSDSVLTENDSPKPEIIENDLYVSSDNDNSKSETENANNNVDVPIDDPNNGHIYETIENDSCSCSDTPSSGEQKFKQSKKSPHYFVVCPTCDIKEYEA